MNIRIALPILTLLLAGCAGLLVRQQDLDAWVGVSVEALDTHSLFLTVPMVRTRSESGIEIRNYANGRDNFQCRTTLRDGYVSPTAFTECSSNRVVCNNIFYIRDGKVIEYAPTGRCYTNESVQPQAQYRRLSAPPS